MLEQPAIPANLESRLIRKGTTAEQIQAERERLLAEFKLTVITTFDSSEKTNGLKDVTGCETDNGERVILRIGERRPDWLFPQGFTGETIRFPRQLHAGGTAIPYEIEEWIEGNMLYVGQEEWGQRGQLSPEMQDKLLAAFWESQTILKDFPLEQLFNTDRLRAFFTNAGELVPSEAKAIIDDNEEFWNGSYPAKWKFASDNLIIDTNGKIVLIDNVKVGARYFGYDLGWVIWPRWIEMATENFSDVDGQLAYLDALKQKLIDSKPAGADAPSDLSRAFDLMLFERLIGSLFDVQQHTRHLTDWGMEGNDGVDRRQAHTVFLQNLLSRIANRLSSS